MKPNVLHPVELSDRLESVSVSEALAFLDGKYFKDDVNNFYAEFNCGKHRELHMEMNCRSRPAVTHTYILPTEHFKIGKGIMDSIASAIFHFQEVYCPIRDFEAYRKLSRVD